jgi:hypothetical protein
MTDRAKKISELLVTTSVANTDKLIVLKDPSGTPLTRSVTVNTIATSIVSNYIANSYVANIGANGNIEVKAKQSNTSDQGGSLLLKAGSSNTGTGGYVEIWSGNGVSGAAVTLKTWSGSVWQSWSFGADGNFYFPDGTSQNTAHNPSPVRVVTDTVYIATATDEVILCNPNSAGANITIDLPVTNVANGKTYIIKNINAGSYDVIVESANGASLIEASGGTLESNVVLGSTGNCATWIYGSGAYRLISVM